MSALTQTVNERLAAAVIANGGTASHLTMTTNQLLAALYNAVSAGPDLSHLTTNFDELLEATRNELSDDADETSETTDWNTLLNEILTLAEGGGGGGYTADAVHWDGTSYLENATLNSGQHDKLSFALWFRAPPVTNIAGFWITDPSAPNFSYGEISLPGEVGQTNIQFTLVDADQTTYLATSNNNNTEGFLLNVDTWYVYMGSADCSSALGIVLAYVNDTDVSGETENLGGPSAVFQGDGVEMRIGIPDPVPRDPYDMANFMMWYGLAVDFSVQANRRFFIDGSGKPVDPALAVAQFGDPTVWMQGDATAFQTNQGTGGPFTLSGVLTNAATSPSD